MIAGFEPLDVMQAILMLVRQVNRGAAHVENEFTRAVTPEGIMKAVAAYFNVTEADLLSQRRNREIATARQVAMYLTREQTRLSTTRIGDLYGGRDHTTVMHACDKIAELAETDDAIRSAIQALKK